MQGRRWYIVQTYAGLENSVKADLESRIVTMEQQDVIFNVMAPDEEYIEEKKDGKKVVKTRKIYPSYVFVEMIVNEKSWFIVRNTPKVTGFLGSSGKGTPPIPIPADEINALLRRIGKLESPTSNLNVGDIITIIAGSFASDKKYEIKSIDEENEKVTVLIDMFGRSTETEFDIQDVMKSELEQ